VLGVRTLGEKKKNASEHEIGGYVRTPPALTLYLT